MKKYVMVYCEAFYENNLDPYILMWKKDTPEQPYSKWTLVGGEVADEDPFMAVRKIYFDKTGFDDQDHLNWQGIIKDRDFVINVFRNYHPPLRNPKPTVGTEYLEWRRLETVLRNRGNLSPILRVALPLLHNREYYWEIERVEKESNPEKHVLTVTLRE